MIFISRTPSNIKYTVDCQGTSMGSWFSKQGDRLSLSGQREVVFLAVYEGMASKKKKYKLK